MRIAIIGCMVFNREISYLVSQSRHVIRVWWLRQGLHNTPDILRTELQHAIDKVERENERLPENLRYEAIVLAYGLCSNGLIGLRSRTLPLVAPRCDDCISLFLGSADRYREVFSKMPAYTGTTPLDRAGRPALQGALCAPPRRVCRGVRRGERGFPDGMQQQLDGQL